MKKLFFLIAFLSSTLAIHSQEINNLSGHPIQHWMNEYELSRQDEIGLGFRETPPPTAPISNIAEFEPMQAVLVRYPFGITTAFIAQLSQVTHVITLVSSNYEQNMVTQNYQSNGVNMTNVEFVIAPTNSYWTRDYGPWFVIDGNDEFGIVDFVYNRPRYYDDAIPEYMANYLDINYFSMDMVHTGGNYMSDGYGTAASTTLVVSENASASSLADMADDYLGIDNYYFLDDPLNDYIEHIDCWGKFLAVDKVLIGQVSTGDSRYADYEAMANWFASTTTPWGNQYQVYRVFTPGTNNTATPYTNSLIINDHVFLPITNCQWDEDAIEAYQEAMPGYTIVPVSERSDAPWENTDALHCRTHEIPDIGMLRIVHYPILGDQPYQNEFIIQADITAYSGENLVEDSILIHYWINDGNEQIVQMHAVGGKRWEGSIPISDGNCTISYYLSAKDLSQRVERHPYIGAADPHSFHIAGQGMASLDKHPVTIYPNPANNYFTISSPNISIINIYNSFGQLIHTFYPQQSKININCSAWQSGIYIIRFTTSEGKIINKKITITH